MSTGFPGTTKNNRNNSDNAAQTTGTTTSVRRTMYPSSVRLLHPDVVVGHEVQRALHEVVHVGGVHDLALVPVERDHDDVVEDDLLDLVVDPVAGALVLRGPGLTDHLVELRI